MSALPLRAQILERAALANAAIDSDQADKFVAYYTLLERWNQKINLTALPLAARADATIDRLLIEPLIAAPQVEKADLEWLDFGTGGGSPALPLKIMRPLARLTMVEVKERKAAFLREAVSTLGLTDATVKTARIEELVATQPRESADLITARAVRMDQEILDTARNLLKLHGRLVIFRGESPIDVGQLFALAAEQNLSPSTGFLSTFRRIT